MTEIKTLKIEIRRDVFKFCAVDNHKTKKGKSYDIIYKAETANQLTKFMIEKGIWN